MSRQKFGIPLKQLTFYTHTTNATKPPHLKQQYTDQSNRGNSEEEVSERQDEEPAERRGEERSQEEHGAALRVQRSQGETHEDNRGCDKGGHDDPDKGVVC